MTMVTKSYFWMFGVYY